MPTHTTLGSLFSDIADSIRAKTGSEEIIIADNFPSEIDNITTGVEIDDTTATASDVVSPKIFYTADGTRTTGNIATKSSGDLTSSGSTVSVPSGYYASSASKAIENGSATTPATTISVTPTISVGTDAKISVSVSGSQSVTPTVSAGYISSGVAGTITVSGSNTSQMTLRNSNSLSVSGNTVSVPAGYYASSASKSVGTAKTAATYYVTTSDQSISSGYYLSGAQTIKAVSSSNYSAGNIKKGVTISVSNGSSNVYSVAGTYTTISSGQTAVVAGAMLSGYSGFANGGAEVKGNIASKTASNASVSDNVVSVPAGYYASSFTKTCGTAQAAKTVYASSSNVTALAAGYYTTGAVTVNKVSATNLAAANIKSGTTISISNGSSNIWSVAGTAGIRYAYSTTLSPAGTKAFTCASNTGATSITCYYVSFNPGFTPTVIQITSKTETLRRVTWDGDLSYYCVLWDGTSYWACAGCTITSSSVQVPCSRQNEQVYVRCFA